MVFFIAFFVTPLIHLGEFQITNILNIFKASLQILCNLSNLKK